MELSGAGGVEKFSTGALFTVHATAGESDEASWGHPPRLSGGTSDSGAVDYIASVSLTSQIAAELTPESSRRQGIVISP